MHMSVNSIFDRLKSHIYSEPTTEWNLFITSLYETLYKSLREITHIRNWEEPTYREIRELAKTVSAPIKLLVYIGRRMQLKNDPQGMQYGFLTHLAFKQIQHSMEQTERDLQPYLNLLAETGMRIVNSQDGLLFYLNDNATLAHWKHIAEQTLAGEPDSRSTTYTMDDFSRCYHGLYPYNALERMLNETDESQRRIFDQIHKHILDNKWNLLSVDCVGCDYYVIKYEPAINTIHLTVEIIFGQIYINMPFKYSVIRHLFDLADEDMKAYIIQNINPYIYCGSDFCCGAIAAYLKHNNKQVKVCHSDEYCPNNLLVSCQDPSCIDKAIMLIDHLYTNVERSLNKFEYHIQDYDSMHVLGYLHMANICAKPTQNFIENCLEKTDGSSSKIDNLYALANQPSTTEQWGVTINFCDGQNYTYLFGIACSAPETLDCENLSSDMLLTEIAGGPYICIRDNLSDYNGMWEYFEYTVKTRTNLKMDIKRHPVEIIKEGKVKELRIPVCQQNLYLDSAEEYTIESTPTIRLAGFVNYTEEGHPLFRSLDDAKQRLIQYYPNCRKFVYGKHHAYLGKSYRSFAGIEVGWSDDIPEGLQEIIVDKGYWAIKKHRYFNGLQADTYAPDDYFHADFPYTWAHPRPWLCFDYHDRAGYSVTHVPVKLEAHHYQFEIFEKPDLIMIGKEELPNDPVTDSDIQHFYQLSHSRNTDFYIIAFHNLKRFFTPSINNTPFFKGYAALPDTMTDDGFEKRLFIGGLYIRVYETIDNGEMDWDMPRYIANKLSRLTDYTMNNDRPIFIYQSYNKKKFEMHIPVQAKNKKVMKCL